MNRKSGIEILQNALIKAQNEYLEFIVCFVDINNLKLVNDTYGHPEGDYLVTSVSQIIKQELEESDVFFRFGGDEFIIVFFHKQLGEVQDIWREINCAFYQINESSNKPYTISVSHGLYQYKSGMDVSLEEIIDLADKEMYKEKK